MSKPIIVLDDSADWGRVQQLFLDIQHVLDKAIVQVERGQSPMKTFKQMKLLVESTDVFVRSRWGSPA